MHARRTLASAFASERWQAQYSRDPILAYLPKTGPNGSAGIGRPPRRRIAVPGRTALSSIAIGCPFESNLTALSGE
jgi:hypothetical protein